MVIFKSKRKRFNDMIKIKLSGKRIYPTASAAFEFQLKSRRQNNCPGGS